MESLDGYTLALHVGHIGGVVLYQLREGSPMILPILLQIGSLARAIAFCHLIVANPPDRLACVQWSNLNTVLSGNAAGQLF